MICFEPFRKVFNTPQIRLVPIKSWENKWLDGYLIGAPLSTGFVCDESIFAGHAFVFAVEVVARRFSAHEVELASKQCQFTNL